MKRKLLTVLAAIVGLIITAVLVTASMWPTINAVETGQTREYPDILPQYFSADPKRVFDETLAAVQSLENFAIVTSDASTRRIDATHTSAVLGFVDDVTITVVPQTDFVTRIDVRSASRVGNGDLGQNARNIRAIQAELDRRLGAVRFDPYANADAPPAQ